MTDALELETPACDLCGAQEERAMYAVKDRRFNGPGEWKLVECLRCSLRYLSPRPTAASIAAFYPSVYEAHCKKCPSMVQRVRDFFEDSVWNRYLRLFLTGTYPVFFFPKHAPRFAVAGRASRLLDVGCGSGDKLRYIRNRSAWETFGVDFSPTAVDNARARGAGDVRLRTDHRLPFDDQFFDGIMSWHSLEHHYSPKATMSEAARVLRPGGYGIFAVPSGDNLGMRMFRSYWGPLEPPRHLYHFTEETITRLMTDAGLKVHKVSYDFSFYGLFLNQEIFESLGYVAREKGGVLGALLALPLKLLRWEGLLSSALTVPILPFNWLLGRLWRGTNMIVHFSKPGVA
jgi:SAM-dependent methyltransferase